MAPQELTLELVPQARFDVIDVRQRAEALNRDFFQAYAHCLYCSWHTTGGYLEQSLAVRLQRQASGVGPYVGLFRTLFPEGAGYRHDDLDQRTDLSTDQRLVEPRNADSHLAFIAGGLRSCVTYANDRPGPVWFIDLDGCCGEAVRRRKTTLVGYQGEEPVAEMSLEVPVSGHTVDSVNLKDPGLGLYDRLQELVVRYGVAKGRVHLDLAAAETHAGLTVNEYETLLMRHDLIDVLRDPLRFAVEKARHAIADPRAVPTKTFDYAKYDLVRAFNQVVDAVGLGESIIERWLARALAVPAAHFLRMKRSVSLLVSNREGSSEGAIVEGLYQSPILVQWRPAAHRSRRLTATLTRFV